MLRSLQGCGSPSAAPEASASQCYKLNSYLRFLDKRYGTIQFWNLPLGCRTLRAQGAPVDA